MTLSGRFRGYFRAGGSDLGSSLDKRPRHKCHSLTLLLAADVSFSQNNPEPKGIIHTTRWRRRAKQPTLQFHSFRIVVGIVLHYFFFLLYPKQLQSFLLRKTVSDDPWPILVVLKTATDATFLWHWQCLPHRLPVINRTPNKPVRAPASKACGFACWFTTAVECCCPRVAVNPRDHPTPTGYQLHSFK